MPRKGPAPRRDLMPDPVYRSVVVTQVVNKILLSGKRSTAEHIVYSALKDIERKIKRAVTDTDDGADAVRYDPVAKPGVSNLLELLATIDIPGKRAA